MIDDLRHCPCCGSRREFVQVHPRLGRCPDSQGESCPEWFCTACGAALLVGLLPPARTELVAASARPAAGQLGRVA